MSSPYIYRPSTPFQYHQQTPYYQHPPQSTTPFIPDATLYPPSAYSNPSSLPGSPNRGPSNLPNTSNYVPFPGSGYGMDYASTWDPVNRQRRLSWHGDPPSDGHNAQWLQPTYPVGLGYNRRHSFGNGGQQVPAWSQPQQAGGMLSPNSYFSHSQFHIHPWLNAESPRGDFFFDLSTPAFSPLRLYGPGQTGPITMEDLQQAATHPPLTRLRIVCDMIPQWPIDLEFDPYQAGANQPPPITLGDVLVAIHRAMHQRISHVDWAKLSGPEETAVARAYTRRCRAVPSMSELESAQGVKRVDFLLGRSRFVGLVRTGSDMMKMIVSGG